MALKKGSARAYWNDLLSETGIIEWAGTVEQYIFPTGNLM
jgi:hypothetical protein